MRLDEMLPFVARAVRVAEPGAPSEMLLADIAAAAREFTERAKVLTRDLVVDLQDCVPSYALECADLEVFEIAQVHVRGREYPMRPGADNGGQRFCVAGESVRFDPGQQTLFLEPVPRGDCPGGIQVRAVVVTSGQPCETLPDELRRYQRGIEAGAVRNAFMALAPKGGDRWSHYFEAAITAAVTRRMFGYGSRSAKITAEGFISR